MSIDQMDSYPNYQNVLQETSQRRMPTGENVTRQDRATSSSSAKKIHTINDGDGDGNLNAALRDGAKKLRKQQERSQNLDNEIMQSVSDKSLKCCGVISAVGLGVISAVGLIYWICKSTR